MYILLVITLIFMSIFTISDFAYIVIQVRHPPPLQSISFLPLIFFDSVPYLIKVSSQSMIVGEEMFGQSLHRMSTST